MKIFDFNPNTRSLMDKVSGTVPTNGGMEFIRTGKGN